MVTAREVKLDFKHPLGLTSLAVIVLTFILFVLALFTKGWTHDLLLEAGIFLVSVKIIILSFKNTVAVEAIENKLDQILTGEKHLEQILKDLKKA
jgi:hypothetical protein